MIDYFFVINIFSAGITKDPRKVITYEAREFFQTVFSQIRACEKRHYLGYFSYLKIDPGGTFLRFNFLTFFLVLIVFKC